MCINRHISLLIPAAAAAVLILIQSAHADLLIKVDKSAQRMTVSLNGERLYDWPVSTGGGGYDTPSGTFRPFRMDVDHHSDEWDNAPMPYSIFFTKTGDAIHGTYEQGHLGRAVSHGCVRLSLKNAAKLWQLVKQEKMANTTVVLTGVQTNTGLAARSRPMPLNAAQYQNGGPPVEEQTPGYDDDRDGMPRPPQQPRYGGENNNGPPFPFLFGSWR